MDTWILFCAFFVLSKSWRAICHRGKNLPGAPSERCSDFSATHRAKQRDLTQPNLLQKTNCHTGKSLGRKKNPIFSWCSWLSLVLARKLPCVCGLMKAAVISVSMLQGGAVRVAMAAAGCSIPCTPRCTAGRPSMMGLCIPMHPFWAGAAALVLKTGSGGPGYWSWELSRAFENISIP